MHLPGDAEGEGETLGVVEGDQPSGGPARILQVGHPALEPEP